MSFAKQFSIYIHVPFCRRKCPYCDFNSLALDTFAEPCAELEKYYTEALATELHSIATLSPWKDSECTSLYFGGGTPTVFSSNFFSRMISSIRENFKINESIEITVEANPGSFPASSPKRYFLELLSAGVTRLSIGVQSLSDAKLRFLGRVHSSKESQTVYSSARKAGFTNISVDLIFGIKGESLNDWQIDLEKTLALKPNHISAYALTIGAGSTFYRLGEQYNRSFAEDDDHLALLYETTQKVLAQAHYDQYEISNYALPGFSSRHNTSYWGRSSYIGLGAGAHSFCVQPGEPTSAFGTRWANIAAPLDYITAIKEQGRAISDQEWLTREQAVLELIFLTLRQKQGLALADYEALAGESFVDKYQVILPTLIAQGLLKKEATRVMLTPRGFLFSDYVFNQLT